MREVQHITRTVRKISSVNDEQKQKESTDITEMFMSK